MSKDGPNFFGGYSSGVGKIYFVVKAGAFKPLFGDEVMESGDGGAFFVVGPLVKYLGSRAVAEKFEAHFVSGG